jgi:hypothetical protein
MIGARMAIMTKLDLLIKNNQTHATRTYYETIINLLLYVVVQGLD